MNIKTINFNNSIADSVHINLEKEELFNDTLIATVVNWQLARRRSGSAKTKLMSEVSGTTAKPHKQKGTGHARQGSKRSVQMRGGRVCFGPAPRVFDYNLPKKVVHKALHNLFRFKLQENKLILFTVSGEESLKTKQIDKVLKDNKVNNALILYNSENVASKALVRSAKNIKNIKTLSYTALNIYDMLKFNFLILDNQLFETLKKAVL